MSKKIVLSVGEVLWDLLPDGPQLGGAPFNFAYRVNSLDNVAMMVSRLGRDELGEKAHQKIIELGMNDRFIQWDESLPTGTVQVNLDDPNNPDYYIVPNVAYDQIELTDELRAFMPSIDCLCFGTLVQRAPKTRETVMTMLELANDTQCLLDINLRKDCYNQETVTQSLSHANLLKLNDNEAHELIEMLDLKADTLASFCAEMIQTWSLSHCLVTLGDRGVLAMEQEGKPIYIPGYKIDLVDPCGSGDAFTAGFLHKLLENNDLKTCCEFGNAYGALVATQSGATTPITPEQIEHFLQNGNERSIDQSFGAYCLM